MMFLAAVLLLLSLLFLLAALLGLFLPKKALWWSTRKSRWIAIGFYPQCALLSFMLALVFMPGESTPWPVLVVIVLLAFFCLGIFGNLHPACLARAAQGKLSRVKPQLAGEAPASAPVAPAKRPAIRRARPAAAPPAEPSDSRYLSMGSFTTPGTVYRIDTQAVNCTCPNWREERSRYNKSDPRRLCKHLLQNLDRLSFDPNRLTQGQADLMRTVILERRGYPLNDRKARQSDWSAWRKDSPRSRNPGITEQDHWWEKLPDALEPILDERMPDTYLPLVAEFCAACLPAGAGLESAKRKAYHTVYLAGSPNKWVCRFSESYGSVFIEIKGYDKHRLQSKPRLTLKMQQRLREVLRGYGFTA